MIPSWLDSGRTNRMSNAVAGSWPSNANSAATASAASTAASTGEAHSMARFGAARAIRLSRIDRLPGRLGGGVAAHHQTDRLGGQLVHRPRLGQRAAEQHRDPVADS